jgi:signal transduction histidine kinase
VRFEWGNGPRALLSAQGVEFAIVVALVALKVMNLVEMIVSALFDDGVSRRAWLEYSSAGLFAASGVVLLAASVRGRRLRPSAVAIDVAVSVAVLLIAPAFAPRGGQPWTDWPVAVSFLVGAEASACLSPLFAAVACSALMSAASLWLTHHPPPTTRHLILISYVPYVGFALGSFLFLTYLRRLAALADARAETIKLLEGERTRRVLHTPYRLLNDLAKLLRIEESRTKAANDDGDEQRARLAEAMASVREIEAIVRGTEPASTNLAADLLRLREQFADLPLIMNVDDVGVDLPPTAVYRIREATRSALQNVRMHAKAGEVVVYATADTTSWLVSVHDDGCGFDPSARRGVGLGELIVAAVQEIGAHVRIQSAPGHGTLIELTGGHTWTITPDHAWSSSTTTR